MNSNLILGLVAFLAITGIGYFAVSSSGTPDTPVATTESSAPTTIVDSEPLAESDVEQTTSVEAGSVAIVPEAEAEKPKESMVETAPVVVTDTPEPTPLASGLYIDYDPVKVASSEAEHVVLFFHAAWCPSCKVLERDIKANIASIPAGVEIYKVDYDTATALKQQFGITRQHSVIEITAAGSAVSSVSHPSSLASLLAAL